ncbi:hypothetical protein [Natrinema sp. 1APR25-10V2]|uniref:CHASE3 domain-containing protein n=1 Tax=Natrinema sp. 1APR25-10V2 TaxID=2951081 RepID=UPI002876845F|nr:hypothetical protein [Natrinema sp. 1APR25-10V2]MDS0474817.1 hypothetical protein [Natrinema sp. 1APR25-10V2]
MSRWRDDRAVTVQIGAVLLLAIVFAALALYQVNAVPAENRAIESEHNGQVQNELQELRNAIRNVGTDGGSASVSVTLGTQYPSRTFLTNPIDPTGSLETTGTANVSLENATFAGDSSDYDGDPSTLVQGNHSTTSLVYHPDYNEYRTAPTTRIEHGFAYNEFENATVSLTKQGLVSDGTIRLVLLNGTLSKSGRDAVSLDPTVLSGPSDPVPVTGDASGNITLTIPTRAPSAWNETIGPTFDTGESNARVVSHADGSLRIELAQRGEPYDMQMTRVGIGDSGEPSDEFDVHRRQGGNGTGASPAYYVDWQDPSGQSSVDDGNCSADSCVVNGSSVDLTMATDGVVDGATVEYAVSNQSVGTVSPSSGTTASDGTNTTTFSVDSTAQDGHTVTVYTSSGSDGDAIDLTISRTGGGGGGGGSGPSVDSFTTQQRPGNNVGIRYSWSVSSTASELDTVVVELYRDGTYVDQNGNTVSGYSASKNNAEFNNLGSGQEYTLELTVTTVNGDSTTATRTRVAG